MLKPNRKAVAATIIGCSVAFLSAPSMAQSSDRPQLTGVWTNASLTSLNRPQGVDSLVVSPADAEKIAAGTAIAGIAPGDFDDNAPSNTESGAPPAGSIDFGLRGYNSFWTDPGSSLALVKGEFRPSYIIDPPSGRVPRLEVPKVSFTDRGFGRRYLTGMGDNSGPEALPLAERCLLGFGNTAGPGMMGTLYNSTYQFVQTDDYVMILAEMAHDARIIPLFDSAEDARANTRPQVMEQWLGDSRGWYEGDTLVVETINIKPIQMEQSSVAITDDGTTTERFSRHSNSEIVYQFIVEDSNLYRQPWTAELSFYATEGPVYEYACHEGNYAMPGMLAGARLQEAEAADNQ